MLGQPSPMTRGHFGIVPPLLGHTNVEMGMVSESNVLSKHAATVE